jgi:hypothetical protein
MLQDLASYVLFAIQVGVLLVGLYAFVHAAMQRTDAYTAAEKLSKPIWLAILGGTSLVGVFLPPPVGSAIAACAVGIYLVDVRPKILEVQGKSR